MTVRTTIVTHGALIKHDLRAEAARGHIHGRQIMSFEGLACRLAGGFVKAIDDDMLRDAVQKALPSVELGELDAIKSLPGMVAASAGTLRKAWRAGLDLQEEACRHARIASVAALETAVLERLPVSAMRPSDIAAVAMERLHLAETLFGTIRLVGITELSPCWRPLLHALASRLSVTWDAGPRQVSGWLNGEVVKVRRADPEVPNVSCISAANARHEVIEAMRWARRLVASGEAKPEQIGISAAIPADYDDDFLSLRADANIDIHFVHGVKVTSTRDGQAAAALADALLRGVSQSRIRRLSSLARGFGGLFDALPDGWTRVLPLDAPLASSTGWDLFLAGLPADAWPDGKDHAPDLRAILNLLEKGASAAKEVGEKLLGGRPLKIWRKALIAGPAASIDATIESLKQPDGIESKGNASASVSICWMPANELAASPRPHVRLLGLNSGRWPRRQSEDRLLADHVIETERLDPLPPSAADRRDFDTIIKTTKTRVIISRSRRDGEGRLLGRSPLLQGLGAETPLRRNAIPIHAFSETDRLVARREEFATDDQAIRGTACWDDWRREELTPHDGIVRPDHPAMEAMLRRVQSANSLKALLRNPLGFAWRYGLHLREPAAGSDPLMLDNLAFGALVHAILEKSLKALESAGGLSAASTEIIEEAARAAAVEVATTWAASQPLPPALVWRHTLADATELSRRGLALRDPTVSGGRSYCEVPFGDAWAQPDGELPWDASVPVEIPGTGFHVNGRVDRIDLSAGVKVALVRDYKTGRPPDETIVLDGGKELQRCLYAFAVRALLGKDVAVAAALFYLRGGDELRLEDPDATMELLIGHLRAARASFLSGAAVVGKDSGGKFDDLAFALPANAAAVYLKRKALAALERLGDAALVWEAV
jgi:RecB family exonuclease